MRTMQINDSVTYVDGGVGAETAAHDHPVGEVMLGARGLLGLRSQLLSTTDSDAGALTGWTTGSHWF
ncbi:hypothetical protein ACFVFI_17770 [Streptomyces sp. NPDC057705]|uniref:hypothetical protein n=1 Tax=Streptomyces sp. NPDC057705 TaxID=3346222 RepID=UPI00368B4DF9